VLCLRLLAQHVTVYGLAARDVPLAGTRADAVEPEPADDEGLDVLARMRRDRARAEMARVSG
jgi:hypothetical protein